MLLIMMLSSIFCVFNNLHLKYYVILFVKYNGVLIINI